MAGLGGLLGAYASDEEEQMEGGCSLLEAGLSASFHNKRVIATRFASGLLLSDAAERVYYATGLRFVLASAADAEQTGQVTLLREDSDAGLDLSHLTSGPAAAAAATTAVAEEGPAGAQPQRPQPAHSEQCSDAELIEGPAAGPQPMEGDGQPVAAGGGGEQPPADPFSLLPAELLEPPEVECDPAVQASMAFLAPPACLYSGAAPVPAAPL